MQEDICDQLSSEPNKQPTALFRGPLTRGRLKRLPNHFFLLSNIGASAFCSALEIEVTAATSREALWRLIVDNRLDGRTFSVFADAESLQAEKIERLKVAWGSPSVQ